MNQFRLVFLCEYDLTEAKCGLNGDGFVFEVPSELAQELVPAVKYTTFLLKVKRAGHTFTNH